MTRNYSSLNSEKAFIWRIIHRDNLPWVFEHGLHCANSPVQAPAYVAIGNAELINRRRTRNVPVAPGGTLADYVPFYFTPFSPMMYNIHTGRGEVAKRANEEICILVSSLPHITNLGIRSVFTDRHAYTPLAQYFNDMSQLNQIDWTLIQARNFMRNPDDPVQIERYQAEALVHQHLPVSALSGIVCYTEAVRMRLNAQAKTHGLTLDIKAIPGWYF
jgi:hypothetical protein